MSGRTPKSHMLLILSVCPDLPPPSPAAPCVFLAAAVSREAVEVPVAVGCFRGRGEAAVCAPASGHGHDGSHYHLGSVQPGESGLTCRVPKEGAYVRSYL